MTIQQFAEQLEHTGSLPPLLEALQAVRACDLDQLRGQGNGLQCGWVVWEDDGGLAQTPQTYVMRPELRS